MDFSLLLSQIRKYFFVVLIGFVFVSIPLLLIRTPGTEDVSYWINENWLPNFEKYGLIKGYEITDDNYPPISYLTVALTGVITKATDFDKLIVFKLINLFFLVFSVGVFYVSTKKIYLSALLYLFLVISSLGLGYTDIYFAPFLLMTVFALRKHRYFVAAGAFAIASLMKFQPLIVAPFIFLYVISLMSDRSLTRRKLLPSILLFLLVFFGCFFLFKDHAFVALIGATRHSTVSPNALNFNWILGKIISINLPGVHESVTVMDSHDYPSIRILSRILFFSIYSLSIFEFIRRKITVERLLTFSIIGFLSYFLFNIGVHENHSFMIILLSGILAAWNKDYVKDFLIQSVLANLNLVVFYGLNGTAPDMMWGETVKIMIALLTVGAFGHIVLTTRQVMMVDP